MKRKKCYGRIFLFSYRLMRRGTYVRWDVFCCWCWVVLTGSVEQICSRSKIYADRFRFYYKWGIYGVRLSCFCHFHDTKWNCEHRSAGENRKFCSRTNQAQSPTACVGFIWTLLWRQSGYNERRLSILVSNAIGNVIEPQVSDTKA